MVLSEAVRQEINRSPFIAEALQADIVNISSLARLILPRVREKTGIEVSSASIGMAITRMPNPGFLHLNKSLSRFMGQLGDITVRSDLVDYSFRNSPSLLHCQSQLLKYLEDHKSFFYSYCKGVHETTLVCSEALGSKVGEIFKHESLIVKRTNLAAVSVNLPTTNLDTYGVYYIILKSLAWKGINIVEVLSTSHEISLIISKEDVQEVFSIVLELKNV